ncbi:hypothetical protein ACFFUB_11505 [Algimonas porphyrae]|uniref:Uncharacterized protein n=1 Tax=Algimonas porphyrae TaxID=1128113 RepID=A0ABQ5V5H2_9PROT|nr:hypothetical protein [Algimonas porphyrae]GLQ21959.1 hypothetical protein GCM10007854_29140 [Algimonas porphyrae]
MIDGSVKQTFELPHSPYAMIEATSLLQDDYGLARLPEAINYWPPDDEIRQIQQANRLRLKTE